MQKMLADGVKDQIAEALSQLGYAHVTLDLQGYRRGSLNVRLGIAALRS
jgi:PP-loop superfamily ATP-utilizing enzyme